MALLTLAQTFMSRGPGRDPQDGALLREGAKMGLYHLKDLLRLMNSEL